MVKFFFLSLFFFILISVISCSNPDFSGNPFDKDGKSYLSSSEEQSSSSSEEEGAGESSSSGEEGGDSSSSDTTGGGEVSSSSSGDEVSSSSSEAVVSSSSSVPPESSSSEEDVPSSSSDNCGDDFGENGFSTEENKKEFCDRRDGEKYSYVEIENQTWMAENLKYNVEGSKCYKEYSGGNSEDYEKYGRYYDWATAMGLPDKCNDEYNADCTIDTPHQGICPDGWHLPSYGEWNELITFAGGSSAAGKNLKATSGWDECGNGKAYECLDTHGFKALPGGIYYYGVFNSVGEGASWWSDMNVEGDKAKSFALDHNSNNVYIQDSDKDYAMSVRCVMNDED